MTSQRGSALVLTLFVCLTSALLCVVLAVMVTGGQEGLAAEQRGRSLLHEAENALGFLAEKAANDWKAGGVELPDGMGTLEPVDRSDGWTLNAKVQITADGATRLLEAQVERGRDGLDLPTAALVAENVALLAGRSLPWLVDTLNREEPLVHLVGLPSVEQPNAPAVSLMPSLWHLDEGSLLRLSGSREEAVTESVVLMEGIPGIKVTLSTGAAGQTPEQPVLAVLTGGADLEASALGEVYGVLVVNGGSIRLEGTRVHGAVFVTRGADLGGKGQVIYSESVLRWACDRSLARARLIPGTRREGFMSRLG